MTMQNSRDLKSWTRKTAIATVMMLGLTYRIVFPPSADGAEKILDKTQSCQCELIKDTTTFVPECLLKQRPKPGTCKSSTVQKTPPSHEPNAAKKAFAQETDQRLNDSPTSLLD